MCLGVVIKNTFVCVVDDGEGASPSLRAARASNRAQSEGVLCPSYLETHSSDLLLGGSTSRFAEAAGVIEEGLLSESEDPRIAEWTRALESGGCEASAVVAEIADHTATLAFEPLGCRVMQHALEVASSAGARLLASGLQGSVLDAARSPHAHFVLEKILYHLGTNDAAFIAQELQGCGRSIALNVYGCGVICRLLEFSARSPLVAALVDEVLAQDTAAMCCHKFGHRVAMSIISNASEGQRSQIIAALHEGGLQRLARHRFAARVLEQALTQGSRAEAQSLAAELMAQAGTVVSLACHSFGVQVVRGLLELPLESKIALQYLQKAISKLRKDKYGAILVNELGLQGPEDGVVSVFAVLGA